MLWRPSYATRVLRGVALPPLAGRGLDGAEGTSPLDGPLLGAFGPLAGAELGVWRRLVGVPAPTVLVGPAWSSRERRELLAATPPSLHALTLLADDPTGAWADLVQPDRPERAFAAVMRGGMASLLMIGPPTEEAWEEFERRLDQEGSPPTDLISRLPDSPLT